MRASFFSPRQRFGVGFLAGLAAGVLAGLLMLLLSLTVNGVSLPEVFGAAITNIMPASTFDYLHELIGVDAKRYLFVIIFVGQCVVFALCGGSYALLLGRIKRRDILEWRDGVWLAALLWLLCGLILLPLIGAGFFGAQLHIGIWQTAISLAVVGLCFGLLFVLTQSWLSRMRLQAQSEADSSPSTTINELNKPAEAKALSDLPAQPGRRSVLRAGVAIVAVGALGTLAWRFISGGFGGTSVAEQVQRFKSKISPPPTPNYGPFQTVAQLSPEVTSNEQYYVVSKNLLSDPVVNASGWQLKVYGQVERPYSLTYAELKALPMKQQYESMMCISNEVGGPYMSNALWEGVPLADLLKQAGSIEPGATKVVLHATDDYSDSIHLAKALEPTTLVALHMNGVNLPTGHGYPARLLVPGIYGMKHVKWITGIEVVKENYQGFWQMRGWSDDAPIRLTSRIDTPLSSAKLAANKPTYIAGVAFSGNKEISEVDVSLDGGQNWQRAVLKRPLSALTWVLWELPWQPHAGSYTVMVRAIDMEGNVQDPSEQPPAPIGSSGYHTISVTVA
ncbi:molybdopterin-dependent oxidoreductase [Ktedonosporobacter rubrisoli]|nr:molybdopterin-dependent oxidoreductase [Ktedonosporobacter rubrisoli]